MDIEQFGNPQEIEGPEKDLFQKTEGYRWYKYNISTARRFFNLTNIRASFHEQNTRKQFLGFVDIILTQGLGVKIKAMGGGTFQRHCLSLCFKPPFLIPSVGRCRSETNNHAKNEHLWTLKTFDV